MTKRSKKWTLGAYSRGAGQFRYLGKFDTPTAACEAAGKKAWVYDRKLKNYVLYDPIKHAGINRVDCGKTPAEAYNFYHAAFRLTCPKLLLAWQSNKQNETAINNGENIVLSAGERIQITAETFAKKSLIGKQNHGRPDTCIRHFLLIQ